MRVCMTSAITMASHAVMNCVPIPIVYRLLGHSNLRMTLRYTHPADCDTKAAGERTETARAQLSAEG